MEIVRCAVVIQRSYFSLFFLKFKFFKQRRKTERRGLIESLDVNVKFRSGRGAAYGIGGLVCLFCFERNLQTFSCPLFLIWHGTSLQLGLLSPCLRKKINFSTIRFDL